MHLNLPAKPAAGRLSMLPDGADGRSAAYKTKKKGQKKGKKKGLAGQKPRLSRSVRYRRPECGGGVCQPGGWLGCTFYAGSVPWAAGAALYAYFLPAESQEGVRLVYALFAELCTVSMHTK